MQARKKRQPVFKVYPFTTDEARELWGSDTPTKEVAEKLGVTVATIQAYARRHNFPARPETAVRWAPNKNAPDPTPEEIAHLAAMLRAKRSAQENEKMYAYGRVEVRQYHYNGRDHVFAEM